MWALQSEQHFYYYTSFECYDTFRVLKNFLWHLLTFKFIEAIQKQITFLKKVGNNAQDLRYKTTI